MCFIVIEHEQSNYAIVLIENAWMFDHSIAIYNCSEIIEVYNTVPFKVLF